MIELVMVLIVLAILAAVAVPRISSDDLGNATDQIIRHIRYTQHLAMSDDKYQSAPTDTSMMETYRTQFWFKQWWHYRLTDSDGKIFAMVFSDQPTNSRTSTFNGKITNSQDSEIAIDPLSGNYMTGNYQEINGDYPPKRDTVETMNLSEAFSITNVVIDNTTYTTSSMSGGASGLGHRISILFDSLGRPYFDEGVSGGGADDDNPYSVADRLPLTTPLTIQLTHSSGDKASICIQPYTGYVSQGACP